MTAAPEPPARSERAAEILAAARRLLEEKGGHTLTMRRLAAEIGIQAPSLYKHFSTKRAVEAALIADGMLEIGRALHAALSASRGGVGAVHRVLDAYRAAALASPGLYRLATSGPLPREDLPAGLEEWAGEPFFLATGDPGRAQAVFSFAHGMVILELDGRFPAGSDLGRTWDAGAAAFSRQLLGQRGDGYRQTGRSPARPRPPEPPHGSGPFRNRPRGRGPA